MADILDVGREAGRIAMIEGGGQEFGKVARELAETYGADTAGYFLEGVAEILQVEASRLRKAMARIVELDTTGKVVSLTRNR